jgi:HK97 gp10 family phage protein
MADPPVSIVVESEAAQRAVRRDAKAVKKQAMPNILKKGVLFLQGEVKDSIAGRKAEPTSVDTGRFLNTVGIKFEETTAAVHANVPYAKYLEFGTTRMAARRHFGNTAKRNAKRIIDLAQQMVKKAT